MAIDNPSYFTLAGGTSSSTKTTTSTPSTLARGHGSGLSALFRRRSHKMGVNSSGGVTSESTSGASMHQDGRCNASGTSTPREECVPMLSRNGAVPVGYGKRRSFRNLFRSISTSADHEKAQQFLKGEPRPCDIAPPSPYLPHRSHSHSENDRRRPDQNRRALKSTSELLSNDMVYCGLANNTKNRNNDDDDDDEDDDTAEVFLSVNDARYYNLSATLPTNSSTTACRRRHSIGTFFGKEASACSNSTHPGRQEIGGTRCPLQLSATATSPNDDVDGVLSNKGKETLCNKDKRRKHRNSPTKGLRSVTNLPRDGYTEDDVLFVSSKESETSNLWINYLTACFEQISRQQGRPPFKVRHMAIEESIVAKTEERIRSSHLQIIVVCPVLLERVRTISEHISRLVSNLVANRVLAMMLGVHDGHINDIHKSSLVNYDEWRKFFVKDQDETFVGELLGAAVGILGTTPPFPLRSDKTAFSVHPKKVKLGQNRIIVLLNDPLSAEDNISVIVDRCGEPINISNVKKKNPYALQFSIPEKCLEVSMLVGVKISRNGHSLGVRQIKCESRLRELDQILRAHDNPLEFMCQTFGFSSRDREQLDNWMVHAFQKNIPPHFNLLSTPSGTIPAGKNHTSPEESPTLLHFAARFGLEKLAWQLLECPGGDLACDLRNVSEMTPADLAEQAGYAKLAHQLRGYMQMNEFTNMYSYLKVMSETTPNRSAGTNSAMDFSSLMANEINNDKEDYCQPRPLSEAYLVPPVARPVTTLIPTLQTITTVNTVTNNVLAANYSIVPAPTPVILPCASDLSLQGYMKMYPAGPKTPTASMTSLQSSRTDTPTQNIRPECYQISSGTREDSCSQKIDKNPTYGRTSSNCSTREQLGPQDELLEIINDFKNNVFTISEVETLVENWRKRNDVQQSFKDKQRQLMAMREEYERIQKKIKEEMKAPTPFEKIRKFFSKGKKDVKESAVVDSSSSKSEINGGLTDCRPVSSLSLRSISSSSSSGRMSTVSGCSGTSFGDSGTHSDSEDRRLQNIRDEKTGIMSYEIPPAPKPFTGRYSPAPRYSPSPNVSVIRDFDARQTQSPSKTNDNEYYIAFPPSGLPVHVFKADGSPREPQTSSPSCDHPNNPQLAQNVTVSLDKLHDDTQTREHVHNNYTNIEPLTSIPTPIVPSEMCIPDSTIRALITTDSIHVQQGLMKEHEVHSNADAETCSDISKVKPSTSCTHRAVDEIDSESSRRCQEDVGTKCSQGRTPVYPLNVLKNTNEATENKLPEYMNLAVNMSHDAAKVLGAIPKKLPAPPVPPRDRCVFGDMNKNL